MLNVLFTNSLNNIRQNFINKCQNFKHKQLIKNNLHIIIYQHSICKSKSIFRSFMLFMISIMSLNSTLSQDINHQTVRTVYKQHLILGDSILVPNIISVKNITKNSILPKSFYKVYQNSKLEIILSDEDILSINDSLEIKFTVLNIPLKFPPLLDTNLVKKPGDNDY